jgi:uncharacterized protein YprB with RNaseH-like and TPR domain
VGEFDEMIEITEAQRQIDSARFRMARLAIAVAREGCYRSWRTSGEEQPRLFGLDMAPFLQPQPRFTWQREALPDPWIPGDFRRPVVGAEIERNRFGDYVAARQWYATPAMCEPQAQTVELLLRSRAAAGRQFRADHACDPEKWLFLDTEATGFIGGAGNLAFLIGLAWWDSGGIQIEQLFMRDAAEEYSILLELARRLRKRPVLVTFNGKSFDWPLLVSRFQMTRAIDVPVLKAHLDFLHPAREIWKLQIGSVKLGHLEERVLGAESLGWSRREDIDSALIPGIYFDYVCGRSHRLEGVFRHNRMDLRGLAALAGRILQMLSLTGEAAPSTDRQALELYGMARFFGRRGHHAIARRYCECALEIGLPVSVASQAQMELARFVKRELRKTRTRHPRARRTKIGKRIS